MNARSVSNRAARRLGILTLTALSLSAQVSRIYVLSTINSTVLSTYAPDGTQIGGAIPLSGTARGLATDAAGRIFLASNQFTNHVVPFMPDWSLSKPIVNSPNGCVAVALDAGRIYVLGTDPKNDGVVRIFSRDGKMLPIVISTGLNNPSGIAVDASGRIFVASKGYQVVKTYDANGTPTTPTIAKLEIPGAIAVGPDGKIYVANRLGVTTYLPNGQPSLPTIVYYSPDTAWYSQPNALAVDASGKIYVGYYAVGRGHGAVIVYNPDGTQSGPIIITPAGVSAVAVH